MPSTSIETALRDLPRHGQLIKNRAYRQIWRFEFEAKAYYLKFYPRHGVRLKRLFRGNPALREFSRLQLLQKAEVPSPRAISMLAGFRIDDELGDAVLMQAIEPGVTLDRYLNDMQMAGEPVPDRRSITEQIAQILQKLAKAKLGHDDLHLGNFLLSQGRVYLLDAYAVRTKGMKVADILGLGHSARRYATRTDMLRVLRHLGGEVLLPINNRTTRRLYKKEHRRVTGENAYFGRLRDGAWSGNYFKHRKFPVRWSAASQMQISAEDWEHEWPNLMQRLDSDQFETIKRTRSGQVVKGEIVLGGRPLSVVIKRPRRKYVHRYFNEIGRGSRSRRAWSKAWSLIVRDIPTAWPLLMMQRRVLGYVVDQIIVFEKVEGEPLSRMDLDSLSRPARDALFRRAGERLRLLEQFGLYHWDAKASNFIVLNDPSRGLVPVLIDVDGIRKIRWTRSGIHRLLDSMRQVNKAYNPADSFALCKGYAPAAKLDRTRAPKPVQDVPKDSQD